MKVLVIGGAGYIGGCVTDELLKKKISFTVYDNLTYENHFLKPVDFIFGDVRDRRRLAKLFPSYTHIVWLAAIVGDGACAIRPDLTKEVNQDSVAWLAKHYDKRIIFTSTCSVYGANIEKVSEDSPTNPLSVYASTKLSAENYLKNNNALILRLGTAFGVGDTHSRLRMDLAVNYMTMNAIRSKRLTVFGGRQWRPFVHVKEIANVIVNNLDTPCRGIYNLTTENSTILDVAKRIKKQTKCAIDVTPEKFEDNRNYNADITKGLRDKVFKKDTKYTIDYGIQQMKELVLSNRITNLDLEYYSNEKYLLQFIAKYENHLRK
jgi:nucleoside-diphosphate-sugar epimerase